MFTTSTVLAEKVTEHGVAVFTCGNLASFQLRRLASDVIRTLRPDEYRKYRALKAGPTGKPTFESRNAALRYLMERAFALTISCVAFTTDDDRE